MSAHITARAPASFAGRVAYAIEGIKRREDSRAFDSCFEMHDGDFVVTAIMRRAQTDPELQAGIIRLFINATDLESVPWNRAATALAHLSDHALEDAARKARADANAQCAETLAYWAAGLEPPAQTSLFD